MILSIRDIQGTLVLEESSDPFGMVLVQIQELLSIRMASRQIQFGIGSSRSACRRFAGSRTHGVVVVVDGERGGAEHG